MSEYPNEIVLRCIMMSGCEWPETIGVLYTPLEEATMGHIEIVKTGEEKTYMLQIRLDNSWKSAIKK